MVTLLRRLFIKDYQNVTNSKVRDAHGKLACFVGIISNLLLFALKMTFGLISGSVAIIGDSINNLSDMGSSIITLLGFKLAAMPADDEHPYGHERIEYIAGLIVSIIILVVGFQLLQDSIEAIIQNTRIEVKIITLVILGISIFIKVWQGFFYKKIAKTIQSVALEATAQDSINDVVSTSVILIGSIIIFFFPNLPFALDGVLGIFVAIFIFIGGIGMIKETMNPLIGINPNHDYIKTILADIKAHSLVLDVHDIRCHMYGPTKAFMSLHVEVPARENFLEAHDEIDNIEREIRKKYGIELTIHMDPVENDNQEVMELKARVAKVIARLGLTFHDFRVVAGSTHTNILFDVAVPIKYKLSKEEIESEIEKEFSGENYFFIIDFDGDYIDKVV